MKRIIDGRTYETDTSTRIAEYEYEDHKGCVTEATLYKNRGGAFFVTHATKTSDKTKYYFEALTYDEVQGLLKTQDNIEIFDERSLSLPPEAVHEAEPAATLYIRVPASLKKRVDKAAEEASLSGNAWAMRCVERCLLDPETQLYELLSICALSFNASEDNDWPDSKRAEAFAKIRQLAHEQGERLCGKDDWEEVTSSFYGRSGEPQSGMAMIENTFPQYSE